MNILFEIADRDLMIIGAILVVILIVLTVIFKFIMRKNRVMPIAEDERYDSEEETEEISEEPVDEEKQRAKAELERVYEQMSADLEKQEKHVDIDAFEREQEENAIISYQELMEAAAKLKEQAPEYETKTEEKADMKVHEALNTYKEHADNAQPKEAYHGFKNSDIISPIYGIQKENEKSSLKNPNSGIMKRAYEEVSPQSENENNIDFLNSLKEFRKNL